MGRILSMISEAFLEPSLEDFSSNRGAMLGSNAMPMLEATASATTQSKTKGALFVVFTPPDNLFIRWRSYFCFLQRNSMGMKK